METYQKPLTYEEAKPIVHRIARKCNLKTKADYENWFDANKEFAELIGLVRNPEEYYTK